MNVEKPNKHFKQPKFGNTNTIAKRISLHMAPEVLDVWGYNLVVPVGSALGTISLDRAIHAGVKT